MSEVSSLVHEQVIDSRTLPPRTVTIFADRAELLRVFDVTLRQGLNNIVIDNVCASIEQDSIRVDGKGEAIIHEVQFKSDRATDAEVDPPEVRELATQLEELEGKRAAIDGLLKVHNHRLESMKNLAEKLGEVTISTKTTDELVRFDADAELTLEKFYGYHERKAVEVNAKIRRANLDAKELDQQIEKVRSQLNRLRYERPVKRSICVALETKLKETKVELWLTYQVYNASWTPSYDIRVDTSAKQAQLRLTYYGNIQQSTGENWTDVNLVLSTAQPRIGGQLPTIGTLQAQFEKPKAQAMAKRSAGGAMFGAAPQAFERQSRSHEAVMMESAMCLKTQDYHAEGHVLSTTFTVLQTKTIPSDGSEHKVTITNLDLHPLLHFDCIPSKNTNVYLTASTLNTSDYPLLAGTASIYVDNSFSAKIYIKSVASGEKFDCSLGVDPTIKVQYKPVHKYQQQTGMLTKSSVTMYEQKIVIKNTKKEEPIILTFVEHVPKSTDEKIRIKLYAPELKSNASAPSTHANNNTPATNDELLKLRVPEAGARLNDAHNLEWTIVMNPLEEQEFVLKYGVEYPPTETLEYMERF